MGVTGLVKWVSSLGGENRVLVNGVSDKEISVSGLSGDLGVTASRGDMFDGDSDVDGCSGGMTYA